MADNEIKLPLLKLGKYCSRSFACRRTIDTKKKLFLNINLLLTFSQSEKKPHEVFTITP